MSLPFTESLTTGIARRVIKTQTQSCDWMSQVHMSLNMMLRCCTHHHIHSTCNLILHEVTVNGKCKGWMKICQPPRGKVFNIHWALETFLGRKPEGIVTLCWQEHASQLCWFSLHYRKPEGNTYCLPKQHMNNFYTIKCIHILERASDADNSKQWAQVMYSSGK